MIVGVGSTVNVTPLLKTPFAFTTTGPVVAPVGTGTRICVPVQLVGAPATPLKVTMPAASVPKFVPVMVTGAPTPPDVGDRPVMFGVGNTVKVTPLLATPPTVTTKGPVLAPAGTGTVIVVAVQVLGIAVVPLNFTVLVPGLAPKFPPLIVTKMPTGPCGGVILVMMGAVVTVNVTPLLGTPFTVTTTGPVVAPVGAKARIWLALQLVGVAFVPLNFKVLVPGVEPKFVPVIATKVPTGPEVGARLAILGVGNTVKRTPLLATPLTVTTTFPVVAPTGTGTLIVVAFHVVGVAIVPLKVTVFAPWLAPKVVPLIVIRVPTGPEDGARLVITGGGVTVNVFALLAFPSTVTITGPVVAPVGTGATMVVVFQLVGVAVVPLNVTAPRIAPKLVPVIVT